MNSPDDQEPVLGRSMRRRLTEEILRGWERDGVCAQVDPEAWFPEAGSFASRQVLETCAACPARRSCLATGLLGREYGVWAGTTEAERRHGRRVLRAGISVETVLAELLALPPARGCGAPDPAPEAGERVA